MIEVEELVFSYRREENTIDHLNFHVPEGSIYGFLGANGSGKTTTIRLILGLCQLKEGVIRIDGEKIGPHSVSVFRRIGALIENPSCYGYLSGYDNLAIWATYQRVSTKRISEVLSIVGLDHVADRKVDTYSLGMKQRLGLAVSLLHDPDLLILDEPLNGLDPKGIADIRAVLLRLKQEEGKTIFISSHLLGEIENTCDSICVIDKGHNLFDGGIDQLRDQLVSTTRFFVRCDRPSAAMPIIQETLQVSPNQLEEGCRFAVEDVEKIPLLIEQLVAGHIRIYEVARESNSLESLYLKLTQS
jgi:ABC-2 type transport system ATP-binding protein